MKQGERKTVISDDQAYRYTLWREWNTLLAQSRFVMFIGLNPSTADADMDDPTIRRCVGFAKLWGYDALCMTNLFAFRATQPRNMMGCPHPIGPENDRWILAYAREASLVVAAWGTHGGFIGRDIEVVGGLLDNSLVCLGMTKHGFPKHPLYVRADAVLTEYHQKGA